jgi:hypothetical protein
VISLYSAFVLGGGDNASSNATSLDMMNGDFESGVAVAGGLRLRSFGVNQRVACDAAQSAGYGIIAQGPGVVDFTNGLLFCGNLLASEDSEIVNLPSFLNGGLVVRTRSSRRRRYLLISPSADLSSHMNSRSVT